MMTKVRPKQTSRTARVARGGGLVAAAALALGAAQLHPVGAQPAWTVVASGLDAPRDLSWGPDGELLVAEAGRGGDVCVPKPAPSGATSTICFGLTAGLTAVRDGVQSRVLEGLPSLAAPGGLEPVGVEGVSYDATTGRTYIVVGLGGTPSQRDDVLPPAAHMLGHLAEVVDGPGGTLRAEPRADLVAYEAAQNPDSGDPGSFIDSNPEGVLAVYGQQFVVDAGGNSVLHRSSRGHVSTLATLDPRRAELPPFLGRPPGTTAWAQAVPTSVVLGPDGALYIGELTGFPFPIGGAQVYRWTASKGAQPWATGFTNISDLAFGPDGSLYVLELAKDSLLAPQTGGRLTRIAPDGTRSVVRDTDLNFPTGVLVGDDGAVYVANCGVCVGGGQVLRLAAA